MLPLSSLQVQRPSPTIVTSVWDEVLDTDRRCFSTHTGKLHTTLHTEQDVFSSAEFTELTVLSPCAPPRWKMQKHINVCCKVITTNLTEMDDGFSNKIQVMVFSQRVALLTHSCPHQSLLIRQPKCCTVCPQQQELVYPQTCWPIHLHHVDLQVYTNADLQVYTNIDS